MNLTEKDLNHPVIYFDGECNLCNGFVQYVIRHDTKGLFRFASLQSDFAKQQGFDIPTTSNGSPETILVEWNGKLLKYADGVLLVLQNLGGLHKLTGGLRIIPRPIRDGAYKWLARHRYFFFGKADNCIMPTPELQARFMS